MNLDDELTMYVVYDSPTDYPCEWVVRRFTTRDSQAVPKELIYRGSNLGEARRAIVQAAPNAIRFNRDLSDERQIVECWI